MQEHLVQLNSKYDELKDRNAKAERQARKYLK